MRVLLAMSGGVDSSVAAHLLVRQGYEVVGAFMRHGERQVTCATGAAQPLPIVQPPASKQGCCSAADAFDAQRVASQLGIPFYALDLQEDFGRLIDYFVDEYTAGRTPNPCVMCNTWLKFGKLFDYADSIDAAYVATGHYARLIPDPSLGTPMLCRGLDQHKDQSYVLFGIDRMRLPRMMLPLGGYQKGEIRQLASDFGLRVAGKPDSQEICFVAPGEHPDFVRRRTGRDSRGEFVDTHGRVLGQHEGIESYTIGQRKGLRVAFGAPRYVVRIEADTRRVVLGTLTDLECGGLRARRLNWLIPTPRQPFSAAVQIRYNSAPLPAVVFPDSDQQVRVEFTVPQPGVAPGQAAVFYSDTRVLGGGWIESSYPPAGSRPEGRSLPAASQESPVP